MGIHSVNEQELLKAKALLGHVNRKLENTQGLLNSAITNLEGISGYGIEAERNAMNGYHAALRLQMEDIKNIEIFIQQLIDSTKTASNNAKMVISGEVESVTPTPDPAPAPVQKPSGTPVKKEEVLEKDDAATNWERMHNTPLIKNSTANGDPGFVEGGCVITSMANLYRRKMALENISVDINRNTIISANNGNIIMYWDVTSQNMQNAYGYRMTYESGATNTDRINQILQDNPEGVMVYAQGTYSPHAIVITGCDNGRYLVVDPIDGIIKYWEDCYSVRSSSGVYYGWSIDQFLGHAYRLGYIPE